MTSKDDIWEKYKLGVKPKERQKNFLKFLPLHVRETHPSTQKTFDRKLIGSGPQRSPSHLISKKQENLSSTKLDRHWEKKLRQGEVDIDAHLDLHGMTQEQAFVALGIFVHKESLIGKRTLLIITGKGRQGEGVLRRNLDKWLSQLPEASRMLALRPAALKHGKDGAFYLLLRKSRKE